MSLFMFESLLPVKIKLLCPKKLHGLITSEQLEIF